MAWPADNKPIGLLGCVDISAQPDKCSGEVDEAKVATGKLVESGEDPSIVFELIEETLDQMTLFVEMMVVESKLGSVFSWRNDRNGTHLIDQVNQLVGIIPSIRDHKVSFLILKEFLRLGDIVSLAASQQEFQ